MSDLAKAALIVLGGLAVSLLLWDVSNRDENRVEHHVQFERSTKWDREIVRDCLREGRGSRFFQDYTQVGTYIGSPGAVEPFLYMNRAGSSLIIEPEGGGAKIRFKSFKKPSEMQIDVLRWCASNPEYTWIAPEFRSNSE